MTTKLPPDEYLKYWEAAEAEEIGILVKVEPEDQVRFINALYDCRNTFGGYENLIVFQPKPAGTVFVAKKTVELPA
jgi:hypothetical protein